MRPWKRSARRASVSWATLHFALPPAASGTSSPPMPKTPPSCRNSKPPPPTSAVRRTTRDLKCEHEESAWWLRMFTDGPLCEH